MPIVKQPDHMLTFSSHFGMSLCWRGDPLGLTD